MTGAAKKSLLIARIDMLAALTAMLMLALAVIAFTTTRLFSGLWRLTDITLPVSDIFVGIALVAVLSALGLIPIWNNVRLRIVMYLAFALYLPSILGFSRLDLLRVAGSTLNFGIFSSSLPPTAILVIGLGLVCGGLLLQSFSGTRRARHSFLTRGADPDEVDHALSRSVIREARLIAASAVIVLLIMAGVAVAAPAMLWIFQSVGFIYVLAGIGAAVILGLIIVAYVRPTKW
ncbi:MAG: hypothetical protein WBZ29_01235 [Methanocella sp.]